MALSETVSLRQGATSRAGYTLKGQDTCPVSHSCECICVPYGHLLAPCRGERVTPWHPFVAITASLLRFVRVADTQGDGRNS